MKHSFASYCLYKISAVCKYVIRTKVKMKDPVDIDILRKAVNIASRRYPYFMVKLSIDEEGSYVLKPNDNDIVVIPTSKNNPDLCSKEVNYHLIYVDCQGKDIYFNFSHALAGGKGKTPWIMTCVYQYVKDKYGIKPNAPSIRKPESPLLEGETAEPTLEMSQGSKSFNQERFKGGKMLLGDYLNQIINPFNQGEEYFEIEFKQKDIMKYAKNTDNSVLSLFVVLMFKAMAKVFPKENKIVCESFHNPTNNMGLFNTYTNVLSHILFLFTKDMQNWDLEKLGTVTRGSMYLQIDPMFSRTEVQKYIEFANEIDKIKGYKNKIKYNKKHNSPISDGNVHGTYFVSYSGYMDFGEVADYMDGYYNIVDGHEMLELSAYQDKIFCCFMQVVRSDKYINAFKEVLNELEIPFTIRGPYKKGLVKHQINCN